VNSVYTLGKHFIALWSNNYTTRQDRTFLRRWS